MLRIILALEANSDLEEAFSWHGDQSSGLDDRFLEEVSSALAQIAEHP